MSDESTTAYLHRVMPLCATLGMRADAYGPDAVILSVDWSPPLSTSGGLLHGGVIMALADAAGGSCAFLNLPDGAAGTSTIESKTNFLGAVRRGAVTATATPLHRGTSTIVIETSVRDDRDRLVAKVVQTQIVLQPRPAAP